MLKLLNYILVFLLVGCSYQVVTSDPFRIPTENPHAARQLIADGIELHDSGKYRQAIKKYDEAVSLNPDHPLPYYELSYSYYALGQYRKSLEASLKAAEFQSDILLMSYVQIGSALDMLNHPEEALDAYHKGLAIDSTNYMLHYNMGITYSNINMNRSARRHLQQAMVYNPGHASSHFALAELYLGDQYRVPAILALCRFLLIEPTTTRAVNALYVLQSLLMEGIEQEDEKHINILLRENQPEYDGDFSGVDMFLSLQAASRFVTDEIDSIVGIQEKSLLEAIMGELEGLFQVLLELQEIQDYTGFAWTYYAPFFVELKNKSLAETFTHYIFQLADDPEIQDWLSSNTERVNELLAWADSY